MEPSDSDELPDRGPVTPNIVEVFERALQGKQDLQNKILHYTATPHPSVRDMLTLCLLKNELSFIDPPLPSGDLAAGIRLQKYWIDHPEELRRYINLRDDILSYLNPPDKFKEIKDRSKAELLNFVVRDSVTLLAFYPIVEELQASPGRPSTRRNAAVRGLQMRIDKNWTWMRIATEVCGEEHNHNECCKETVRQSVMKLEQLLRDCRIEVPKA